MPGEGLLDVRMIGVAAKIDTHEGVTIAGTTINATDLYVRYCAKEFRSLQRLWPGLVQRVECDETRFRWKDSHELPESNHRCDSDTI